VRRSSSFIQRECLNVQMRKSENRNEALEVKLETMLVVAEHI
jgi:hypothetical protein